MELFCTINRQIYSSFRRYFFSKSRKSITNLKFACNQRQFHFKGISSTTVDSTFSAHFAGLKLFRTRRSSVDTLPLRLDSWDRYKGLRRQGRKDDVNIDSSLWSPEAICSDVIRYPKMDIHRTDKGGTSYSRLGKTAVNSGEFLKTLASWHSLSTLHGNL